MKEAHPQEPAAAGLAGGATLVEVLRGHAARRGGAIACTFLDDAGEEAESLTYAGIDRAARAVAARLARAASPGDRALLLYPPGLDFVAGFLGCLYAGVVAVPAYPPRSGRGLSRVRSIVADAAPRLVLTAAGSRNRLAALFGSSPDLAELPLLATGGAAEEEEERLAAEHRDPGVAPGDLAFLQYTSGSTSAPKGVRVSYANLLHNQEAIRQGFGTSAKSVVVGWLPLYHDMGLIGNLLHPLYLGARTILMAPAAFLQQPRRWLSAIARYGATVSGGPSFAYELAARKVALEERAGLDLSRWQVAFNGAEPVRAETLERFAEAFAPCGFSPAAFYPCYGLAEATLFVTGGRPGRGPLVRSWDAAALERHRAEPAATKEGGRRLVGCGGAWGGEIAVVDAETLALLPAGAVGEIWASGPSVAGGYWNRPEESARTFGARLAGREGTWLRTGDLGFLDGGELYVTGRAKDLIILCGRNHYPQDLELAAERGHPAVRPGHVAAFGLDVDGEERLVVVAELERRREGEAAAALAGTRRALAEEHEVAPHEIVLVRMGEMPMTSSGKVRRAACREAYSAGSLAVVARGGAGAAVEEEGPVAEEGLSRTALLSLPAGQRQEALVAFLAGLAARRLGVEAAAAAREPWLELGLDSLGAVELAHRIEEALGAAPPFEAMLGGEGAEALAGRLLEALEAGEEPPSRPAAGPELGEHPTSYGQRSLWFLEGVAPGAHNVAAAARTKALDAAALESALAALVARHPALRTTFVGEEGDVRQVVHAELAADFAIVDGRTWGSVQLDRFLVEEAFRPFDLARGPLVRVRVVERPEGEAVLLWALHHAVTDFWSMVLLARELGALYGGETAASDLPVAVLRYTDFARRQPARLLGEDGERLWTYWREALAGDLPVLELPTDRPRPAARTWRGGVRTLSLPPAAAEAVRGLARRQGTTLHAALLAAWATLLGRAAGQREVMVGTPAAGREAGFAQVVGYFVNLLPLRLELPAGQPFAARLEAVRTTALAGLAHQSFPLALLAERLLAGRDASRPPLFSAALVLEQSNRPGEEALAAWTLGEGGVEVELGGLSLVSQPLPEVRARFELTLGAAERGGGLGLALEHNADLFDGVTAGRLLARLACLLETAAANPEADCDPLSLLPAAERHQLLWEWTDTVDVPEASATLPDLLAAQVANTPDAVAAVAGEERLTFAELARRAANVAARLSGLGVRPEDRVGLLLDRGLELVVGLWGILGSGGAYVPLDPAWPRERQALVLADSGARVLLTEGARQAEWIGWSGTVVVIERPDRSDRSDGSVWSVDRQPRILPGNLAYLIYTSGSTGTPKGVAIEHRSAVALASWVGRTFSPGELSGVLASTSITFDMSVFELALALVHGGRAILAANALALPELPARDEVTLVNTVPSALAALLAMDGLPAGVRTANVGGEALPATLVADLAEHGIGRVLNLYGPSEDTTYSTWAAVDGTVPMPIGRPVDGTRVHLLSEMGEPVPLGSWGDLHLAGAGLARGYLGQPARTAERFVPDPFGGPGERLYRTGDLARYRAGGTLDYGGRLDHQVKVRGFRIEPAEVEAHLLATPGVHEALVLAHPADGGAELVAYVGREAAADPTPAELQAALAARLPAYMVPSRVVVLDALPRNPNGKVDRGALPVPEGAVGEDVPPREATAGTIAEIVTGVLAGALGREALGPHDDFFAQGGHSLLAAAATARLRDALEVEISLGQVFETPTAAGLTAAVENALRLGRTPAEPPRPRAEAGDAPLTSGQQRLWFLDRLQPGAAYNVPLLVRLAGPLSLTALEAALAGLWRRHEALRTNFPEAGGMPVQRVAAAVAPELPRVDLSALPAPELSCETARLAHAFSRRPFDLAAGPVARLLLLRLGKDEHHLLLVLHHIVCDGRSLEILLAELAPLYAAALESRAAPLPAPPLQLADVAVWERLRVAGPGAAESLAFWEGALAGAAPLELAGDRPRPAVRTLAGGSATLPLSPELARGVAALARGERATPFLVILAAFAAQLHRYTGQGDLTIGTPVAGRGEAGLDSVVGFLVNTVGLRTAVARDLPFRELLARVRRAAVAAHGHSDLPFEKVVDRLAPARALSHSPLFQVICALQPAAEPVALAGGLELRPEGVGTDTAKLDLGLAVTWGGTAPALAFEHSADLFDAATAGRMLGHFATLLAGAVAEPGRAAGELPLLSPAELEQVLDEWNRNAVPGPSEWRSVRRQVEERVAERPDALAVEEEGMRWSYRELEDRAGRIGRVLCGLGVGPETVVPVLARRATALLPAALGALQVGAAYAPLDPASPPARLAAMLDQVASGVVLAEGDLGHLLPAGVRIVNLEGDEGEIAAAEPLAPHERAPLLPEQLAYLIFTSGSTGVPKAVAVAHASLANLVAWTHRTYGVLPGDRGTLMAGPAFDVSVWETWSFLAAGASLSRAPEGERLSPPGLVKWMVAERLTLAFLATPVAELVLAEPWPAGAETLRVLFTGGDRLRRRPRADHPFVLANLYGPSEATVVTSCSDVPPSTEDNAGRPPTIGFPVSNLRVALVDAGFVPVPPGIPGELCAGGAGLARGYFGHPDLTAARFVPDPWSGVPGSRLYRTGDLARWLPDGELEFVGRLDHQVKLNGLRIEIGEVEAALHAHPGVGEAVAALATDPRGEGRLVAWVAGRGGELPADLRPFLLARLPTYMVPSALVSLPELPLTANGKVDRAALPAPDWERPELSGEYVAPRTAVESLLAGLWVELLGVERVGVHDSFFELGGQSLKAARLTARLRETFGVELPVQTVFEAPTVAAMSVAVARGLLLARSAGAAAGTRNAEGRP